MTTPFTLAHLSDLHLGPLPPFTVRHWNLKRALGYLNWQRGRRHVHTRHVADLLTADLAVQRADHVAVTGDLVNIALPGEYEAALAWLEGLGQPRDVSVVPGNHDIYTRLGRDPGPERWAGYMRGDAGDGVAPPPVAFPYVRRRGPIALVGLNSAVPTPPFVAAGLVGVAQRIRLAALLDALGRERLFRVVLIHHPPLAGQAPPLRALRDAADLERVLSAHGAELVLHGHNHRDMLSWCHGPCGRFPVLGIASGSATRPHRDEPLARYNLIDVSRLDDGWRVEVRARGLAIVGGPVVELGRTVLSETGSAAGVQDPGPARRL